MKNHRTPQPLERKIWAINLSLVGSTLFASGKFIIGIFFDPNLCVIALYTLVLLLAKLECVLGMKNQQRSLQRQNRLIALFMFFASLVYIGCMVQMLLVPRAPQTLHPLYVYLLAFIAFVEFGFALAGILSKQYHGYLYRNLKIINFIMALIALATTQIAILDFTQTNADAYNAGTGIGIGVVTMLCAVYILLAPRIGVLGHEHQTFYLCVPSQNHLLVDHATTLTLTLCRSWLFGNFVYHATVHDNVVAGDITRTASLWQRMPLWWKIICGILAEILIFVWLIGRLIFFFRSATVPQRLIKTMSQNGFTPQETE